MKRLAHKFLTYLTAPIFLIGGTGVAHAEVISYTLGIHTNCPYGLAR